MDKKKLKDYVIDVVADNYFSHMQQFGNIYNDFNDELLAQMEHDGFTDNEIDYAKKFVTSREFWNALYKKYPTIIPGKIQF